MAAYLISKASFQDNSIITECECYTDLGTSIGEVFRLTRDQLVTAIRNGHTFYTIDRDANLKWQKNARINLVNTVNIFGMAPFIRIDNNIIFQDYLGQLPKVLPRRKAFVSYHHKNDQQYREIFDILTWDLTINKSVNDGDIDSENSDEYIKQLIQKGYLSDTTVVIVLVGIETKERKHVDWEIFGGLDYKIGDKYSGLLGLLLPTHLDYNQQTVRYATLPARLTENIKTGYAPISSWTTNRLQIQNLVELAYNNRFDSNLSRVNRALPQFQRNRGNSIGGYNWRSF